MLTCFGTTHNPQALWHSGLRVHELNGTRARVEVYNDLSPARPHPYSRRQQHGQTGVVSDPAWNGMIKITITSGAALGVVKSYTRAHLQLNQRQQDKLKPSLNSMHSR